MSDLVKSVLDYVDNHLYEEITIDKISKIVFFDKGYLMKKFKAEIGISIVTYINQEKVFNSIKFLYSNDSLLKIALNNGFNSLEYYSEIFSRVLGVSPSIFRKYLSGSCREEELLLIRDSLERYKKFSTNLNKKRSSNDKILQKRYVA